ncbi:PD-(D/E)XK nuclease family protein [Xylophilus sp. GOD-11R]|uniref:PD-(D/E)XK nuclease family protein n=1 Tax=Xylophilus sp. GOD-11R TaxID=3089814 RepID=UPI00298D3F3A|nr:PD-(D/E)XK nuclease family protein [Xylophilus sp. GOD-11R]WPB58719.1 PD-(D/E)XK nuclease family protein [Xylophilus sp. GOD-11R]
MAGIGKSVAAGSAHHPAHAHWNHPQEGIAALIDAALARAKIHPSQALVVLPYPSLLPCARAAWSAHRASGFAPRFDTLTGWARTLGAIPSEPPDVTLDTARDLITAAGLLQQAGLQDQRRALAAPLVEAAQQLARAVAAVPPDARSAWGETARAAIGAGLESPVLAYETAVARIAFEWALSSTHATDPLFTEQAATGLRCMVVVEGAAPDPLAQALAARWESAGRVVTRISLLSSAQAAQPARLHACADAEDEAGRAAACVLGHLEAGRLPVALVSQDRALTRRISAMLRACGATLHDESGWKLSTTSAAAQVAGALRACARLASGDAVLGWLKQSPTFEPAALRTLESALRRAGARQWEGWFVPANKAYAAVPPLVEDIDTLRRAMQRGRPLSAWLAGLRALLDASGQWTALRRDAAGRQVVAVLRLEGAAQAALERSLDAVPGGERRLELFEFTAWVEQALEAESFRPAAPDDESDAAQVSVVAIGQLPGRPFAALVAPGCDERRLAASPDPVGAWTQPQREALGLADRAALQTALALQWRQLLLAPQVDLLWRTGDDGGEAVLPSPMVIALQATPGAAVEGDDPRQQRQVASRPTAVPRPQGDQLPVRRISASAYEDLRKCPYRFFAMRQLRLQDADELDAELDKRDFGLWLHAVLSQFHALLAEQGATDDAARLALMEQAAEAVLAEQRLSPDEFLPFAAAWPQVRRGYLDWLAAHESQGLRFDASEGWHEQSIGELTLIGQIDRVDRAGQLSAEEGSFVIDYKTESLSVTQERIKRPDEDTQLAFYAALLPHGTLRAAYVNVGERGKTTTVEQTDVLDAREMLVEGMLHDLERVAEGAPMPPLGEGQVCDFCAARGLCRKDFWSVA